MSEQSTMAKVPSTNKDSSAKQPGFFLNAANWLLSRLPWFRDRYEAWSNAKRIWIGIPLYFVVLPVIPIVVAIIMYVRDPEAFKRSKAAPILGAIIVAWFGAFGLVAMQPPKVTNNQTSDTAATSVAAPASGSSKTADTLSKAKDTSDSSDPTTASQAKKEVQSKADSEPSNGRDFKNCDAAFKAGVFNIVKTDPSYQDKLDGDNDGVACEK